MADPWFPAARIERPTTRWWRRRSGLRLDGGPVKVVHHKTVTWGESAKALYGKSGSYPHFTVSSSGVQQHLPVDRGAYALKNRRGGVNTNTAGSRVVQIEVVGYPAVTMPEPTAWHLIALLRWLRDEHGVPWRWPAGRPLRALARRDVSAWGLSGHFGHVQVPENDHWDPEYTDVEWWWLHAGQ